LINDLRNRIKNLPILRGRNENDWSDFRIKIRESLLSHDLRKFLRWQIIRYTMFYEPPLHELRHLKSLDNWNFWKTCLKESNIGSPLRYCFMPSSSGNTVHQAYNLSQVFEREMDQSFSGISRIVEFGGGYGNTCRLVYKMGFKGQYIIYDLPELSFLQNLYLKSYNLPATLNTAHANKNSIVLLSELTELSNHLRNGFGDYLLIASWSLSEAPLETRASFLKIVNNPRYLLFAYQEQFSNINNKEYFMSLLSEYNKYKFNHCTIPHLPGNWYLTAKRVDDENI
jgi:hypothetical protein